MKKSFYQTGRRDANEGAIKEYLCEKSIPFISLLPGQGADLVVLLNGCALFVEVKNPDTSKVRKELTDTEKEMLRLCVTRNIPYQVVFSVFDLQEAVKVFSK